MIELGRVRDCKIPQTMRHKVSFSHVVGIESNPNFQVIREMQDVVIFNLCCPKSWGVSLSGTAID